MALVLGKDCRIYWNYQVWELPKGTVVPEGEFADHLRSFADPEIEEVAEPKRRTRRTDT